MITLLNSSLNNSVRKFAYTIINMLTKVMLITFVVSMLLACITDVDMLAYFIIVSFIYLSIYICVKNK